EALHILDRFHIVAKMNKALDEVRAGESRRMATEGRLPVLKKSRWLLLKREENLKTEQRFRLRDLLHYNLKTVRAYLLKEAFPQLPLPRTCALSLTWQITRAGIDPRILLTNHLYDDPNKA